jgi:hypothetical protein
MRRGIGARGGLLLLLLLLRLLLLVLLLMLRLLLLLSLLLLLLLLLLSRVLGVQVGHAGARKVRRGGRVLRRRVLRGKIV